MSNNLSSKLSHSEVAELIPRYINGKLSSDLQREVQEHISHCESCFQAQQESDMVRQLLTPLAADLQPLVSEQRMSANIDRTLANIDHAELNLPAAPHTAWQQSLSWGWQFATGWLRTM